jgi:hypothetical protein
VQLTGGDIVKRFSCLALTLLVVILAVAGCMDQEVKKSDAPAQNSTVQAKKAAEQSSANTPKPKEETSNSATAKETIGNKAETAPQPVLSTVRLVITRDFGQKVLLDKEAAIGGNSSVIDVLKANTDVTTKYDGSYVESIQGLKSHSGIIAGNSDWFYYINGICSDAGAGDYTLRPGEVIWWDYHAWKGTGFVNSAVIGCYPEPFKHGYRGGAAATVVMSSASSLNLAAEAEKALKAQDVSVTRTDLNNNLLEKRSSPVIVIGTWEELKSLAYLNQINSACRKTGTGVHFTDTSLELLDLGGNPARTLNQGAGVITATGTGLGDKNPVWIVAGTDQAGLEQAINLLTKNPGRIARFYSTAVAAGEVIRLPLP